MKHTISSITHTKPQPWSTQYHPSHIKPQLWNKISSVTHTKPQLWNTVSSVILHVVYCYNGKPALHTRWLTTSQTIHHCLLWFAMVRSCRSCQLQSSATTSTHMHLEFSVAPTQKDYPWCNLHLTTAVTMEIYIRKKGHYATRFNRTWTNYLW